MFYVVTTVCYWSGWHKYHLVRAGNVMVQKVPAVVAANMAGKLFHLLVRSVLGFVFFLSHQAQLEIVP